ncbi:MAG: carboxylesterase family protein [Alphaproteobacteria bacterium]|nr:carboxylesterase family protein [Alphaproteobacteria bacterium]
MRSAWVLAWGCAVAACAEPSADKTGDTDTDTDVVVETDTDTVVDSDTDVAVDTDPPVPAPCPEGTSDAVPTTTGCVIGHRTDGRFEALGIPYAEPPLGDLRFARTVPKAPWPEPFHADAFGSVCLQANGTLDGELQAGDGDEDCLTLNVIAPVGASDLPVLVFVHGGGHVDGAGSLGLYTDDPLLADGAVLVTLNYRLGALGWLAHPDLSDADPDGVSGNQGLRDVLTALRWVHDNAAAFGGDPSRLLLFGESAGGVTSCAAWLTDGIDDLASAVLSESAPCSAVNLPLDTLRSDGGERQGQRVATALGCADAADVVACMRAASAADVIAAVPGRQGLLGDGDPYGPVIDGVLLPRSFADAVDDDVLASVPLYATVNADEGTTFLAGVPVPDEATYRAMALPYALLYTVSVDTLVTTWSAAEYGDYQAAAAALLTDASFVCPTRRVLRQVQAAGHGPARGLFWERPLLGVGALGAFHGAELAYVFGTLTALAPRADRDLSAAMRAGWTGLPGGVSAVGAVDPWPTVDVGWAHVATDASLDVVTDVRESKCRVLGL